MKKNGFTLIEVIAVIVVLALLLIMIVPNLINTLNHSKENLNKNQIAMIEHAAVIWGTDKLELEGTSNPSFVTIKQLQDEGYLDDNEVKDMRDKTNLKTGNKVCIKKESNQFTYKYVGEGSC